MDVLLSGTRSTSFDDEENDDNDGDAFVGRSIDGASRRASCTSPRPANVDVDHFAAAGFTALMALPATTPGHRIVTDATDAPPLTDCDVCRVRPRSTICRLHLPLPVVAFSFWGGFSGEEVSFRSLPQASVLHIVPSYPRGV